MDARLPAHLEVAALLRQVQTMGGFGMVLNKGEPDAGTILLVLIERGQPARAYERMPDMNGNRIWHCAHRQGADDPRAFDDLIRRRAERDPDLWVVELDVADGERLIGMVS